MTYLATSLKLAKFSVTERTAGRFTQREALTRKAAAARSAWERIRRGKVLLHCVCSAAREALGRPRGGEGRGHIKSNQIKFNSSEYIGSI